MLFYSHLSFPLFLSITEWQWTDASSFGCLLPERRLSPAALAAEADVCDQLHGDGESDGCASHLPALKRTADQSCLSAATTGNKGKHGDSHCTSTSYLLTVTVGVCTCLGHETGPGHACCKDRRRRGLHWSYCHWARERVSNNCCQCECISPLSSWCWWFLEASHTSFHRHLILCVGITAFLLPLWISPPCTPPSWWLTICATPHCCRKARQKKTGKRVFSNVVIVKIMRTDVLFVSLLPGIEKMAEVMLCYVGV